MIYRSHFKAESWLVLINALLCFSWQFYAEGQITPNELGSKLSEEQKDVREYIEEIRHRMQKLSQNIKDKRPDESERLDTASQKIGSSQIDEDLTKLQLILTSAKFLEALKPQDEVVSNIQEIIDILEARKIQEKASRIGSKISRR